MPVLRCFRLLNMSRDQDTHIASAPLTALSMRLVQLVQLGKNTRKHFKILPPEKATPLLLPVPQLFSHKLLRFLCETPGVQGPGWPAQPQ